MSQAKYVWIWVWLAMLMLLGVLLSTLPIPHRTVGLIVLGLSTVKALLVAGYYMHLKFDPKFLTWVAVIPIPFCLILAITLLLDTPFVR